MSADNAPIPIRPGETVLHLSADFPDRFEAGKTAVIRTLVELAGNDFDHAVVSLNRIAPANPLFPPRDPLAELAQDGEVCAIRYLAPARGLWHRTMLERLGDALAMRCAAPLALIVGHKLTVEGIVAARMARRLGVPYALSIQGDTDTKILNARPDLRRAFAAVFHGAAMVFPFAPWALEEVEQRLGKRKGPITILPCPLASDAMLAPVAGNGALVSAFHLKSRKRKNLAGLVAASRLAAAQQSGFSLEIIGGGSHADMEGARAIIANNPAVSLAGRVEHDAMAACMNAFSGFVLPSLRESFGLVFVEAAFAGIPFAYPRDRAVSGLFDTCGFALAMDPQSPQDIAAAMQHLCRNESALKAELASWQTSGKADRFRRGMIANDFIAGLATAIDAGRPAG